MGCSRPVSANHRARCFRRRDFRPHAAGRISPRVGGTSPPPSGDVPFDRAGLAPDLVEFAEPGDLILLGTRSLEGLNLKVDPVRKTLVPAGPVIAAST